MWQERRESDLPLRRFGRENPKEKACEASEGQERAYLTSRQAPARKDLVRRGSGGRSFPEQRGRS